MFVYCRSKNKGIKTHDLQNRFLQGTILAMIVILNQKKMKMEILRNVGTV